VARYRNEHIATVVEVKSTRRDVPVRIRSRRRHSRLFTSTEERNSRKNERID